jgi:hypothetical protein
LGWKDDRCGFGCYASIFDLCAPVRQTKTSIKNEELKAMGIWVPLILEKVMEKEKEQSQFSPVPSLGRR